MYPPPAQQPGVPPGAVVVTTTVVRPRAFYGGGGYSPQMSRAMRAFAIFFFVAVVLSFALSFGLRTGSSSSSTANLLYFILPAIFLLLIRVIFAVRMAALRAAARQQAEGATAVVGTSWVPTATPVSYAPGAQTVPGSPMAYPVVNTYPGAPSYASSLALPPPPGGGAPQTLPAQAAPCAVCLAAPRTTALGCGHVFCDRCAAQLSTCALCRAPVVSRIRLYG